MAPISSSDIILYQSNDATLSSTQLYMEQDNYNFMQEATNGLRKKRIAKSVVVKIKKKMFPARTSHYQPKFNEKHEIPITIPVPSTTLATPAINDYIYPLAINDWHPFHTPLITLPTIPILIPTPTPIFATTVCPFTATAFQPVFPPIIPQTLVQEDILNISNHTYEYNYTGNSLDAVSSTVNSLSYYTQKESITHLEDINTSVSEIDSTNNNIESVENVLELYLKLPKDLFPTARMLSVDPNPIIDVFCKVPNIQNHIPWLLDLEFGIPKSPITRPIPTYNVKFNSIHCKNTPDAIHPGFETCDPDFKKMLLFYYDCVVSAWYKGYIIKNCDRSVDNFQTWLLLPMQVLGMCWP